MSYTVFGQIPRPLSPDLGMRMISHDPTVYRPAQCNMGKLTMCFNYSSQCAPSQADSHARDDNGFTLTTNKKLAMLCQNSLRLHSCMSCPSDHISGE